MLLTNATYEIILRNFAFPEIFHNFVPTTSQVHDVVVSVPTYFTDAERRALLDAARYCTHCVIVTLVMVYNVPSHLYSHLPLKTPRFGNVPW